MRGSCSPTKYIDDAAAAETGLHRHPAAFAAAHPTDDRGLGSISERALLEVV
jgi:hypothetical protein